MDMSEPGGIVDGEGVRFAEGERSPFATARLRSEARYFVFAAGVDGDIHVEPMDAATLRARLAERYYGDGMRFIDSLTGRTGPAYWGTGIVLIVKGEIVTPLPVERVTVWEV